MVEIVVILMQHPGQGRLPNLPRTCQQDDLLIQILLDIFFKRAFHYDQNTPHSEKVKTISECLSKQMSKKAGVSLRESEIGRVSIIS